MTPYLPREHDAVLRQVMALALDGGPSVLVMLTGGSSTGKTRALYEALGDLASNRPLLRPSTAADLLAIAERRLITAWAVLWLNETQRFLDGGEERRLRPVCEYSWNSSPASWHWERCGSNRTGRGSFGRVCRETRTARLGHSSRADSPGGSRSRASCRSVTRNAGATLLSDTVTCG
ncbi:hypothetical protein ACFQ0M_07875 [Kitasatospora aburaviensis]